MPIYSEIIDNEKILEYLDKKSHNILIIGCGGCMNESLAYKNNLPIVKLNANNNELIPIPIEAELHRIAEMLEKNGYEVQIYVNKEGSPIGCMTNVSSDFSYKLYDRMKQSDTILVASCPAGAEGFKRISGNIPVFHITKQIGAICYSYNMNQYGERDMIQDSVKIFPFNS